MNWMNWVVAAGASALLSLTAFAWKRSLAPRRETTLAAASMAFLGSTLVASLLADALPAWSAQLLAAAAASALAAAVTFFVFAYPHPLPIPTFLLLSILVGGVAVLVGVSSQIEPVEPFHVFYPLAIIPFAGILIPQVAKEEPEWHQHLQWQAGLLSFALYGAGVAFQRILDFPNLLLHLILFLILADQGRRNILLFNDGKPPEPPSAKESFRKTLPITVGMAASSVGPPWTLLAVAAAGGWYVFLASMRDRIGSPWFRGRLLAIAALTTLTLIVAFFHAWVAQHGLMVPVLFFFAELGFGRFFYPDEPRRSQMQGLAAGSVVALSLIRFPALEPVWTMLACLALAVFIVKGLRKPVARVKARDSLTVAWRTD